LSNVEMCPHSPHTTDVSYGSLPQCSGHRPHCPSLPLGRAENPPDQAHGYQKSADELNKQLNDRILDKGPAQEENSASQNDDGRADVLTSARRVQRANTKPCNMSCRLCRGLFVFDVFHKRAKSSNTIVVRNLQPGNTFALTIGGVNVFSGSLVCVHARDSARGDRKESTRLGRGTSGAWSAPGSRSGIR